MSSGGFAAGMRLSRQHVILSNFSPIMSICMNILAIFCWPRATVTQQSRHFAPGWRWSLKTPTCGTCLITWFLKSKRRQPLIVPDMQVCSKARIFYTPENSRRLSGPSAPLSHTMIAIRIGIGGFQRLSIISDRGPKRRRLRRKRPGAHLKRHVIGNISAICAQRRARSKPQKQHFAVPARLNPTAPARSVR